MIESILVTGGSGSIGSVLIQSLRAQGHRVVNLDTVAPSDEAASNENYLALNVTDSTLVEKLENQTFDRIIHLASLNSERKSFEHVLAYHTTNVSGTLQILEVARKLNVRKFDLFSTIAVRDSNGAFVRTPRSPFVATKIAAEHFAEVYVKLHNIDARIFRLPSVFGSDMGSDFQLTLRSIVNQNACNLSEAVNSFRPLHLNDILRAYLSTNDAKGLSIVEFIGSVVVRDEDLPELLGKSDIKILRNTNVKLFGDIESLEGSNTIQPGGSILGAELRASAQA